MFSVGKPMAILPVLMLVDRGRFEPNHFRSLGIEPIAWKIVICKAELQHRAGFAGLARKFIDVDTPGLATQTLSRLPCQKIRRPVFPLDDR
jgi:microcystin degradation protein MlrC